MSRFCRIVLAACAFLAALAVGTMGGYTVGYIVAYSQPQPASSTGSPFYSMLYTGSAMGVIVGTWMAFLILTPPTAVDKMAGEGEEDQR